MSTAKERLLSRATMKQTRENTIAVPDAAAAERRRASENQAMQRAYHASYQNAAANRSQQAGTQRAVSLPVSQSKTAAQIIAKNRIAAQKTGAPVLGESVSGRARENRRRGRGNELRAVLPAATTRLPVSGKVPTLAERVASTVSGAAKNWGSSMANTAGTAFQAVSGGKLKDMEQEQRDIQRTMALMEEGHRAGGFTPDEEQTYRQELARQREKLRILGETMRATAGTGGAAQTLADDLSASGAADTERAKQGLGGLGRFAVDTGSGALQMGGDIAAGILTGGGALPAMFARSFGGGAREARQAGATQNQQLLYGLGSGALSVATEKIANVAAPFKKAFGGGVLDAAIDKAAGKLGQSAAGKLALSMLSEGGEEFIEDVFQPVLKRAVYDKSASFDLGGALYDAAVGAALGGIGGSAEVLQGKGAADGPEARPVGAQEKTAPRTKTETAVQADTSFSQVESIEIEPSARISVPGNPAEQPVNAIDDSINSIPASGMKVNAENGRVTQLLIDALAGKKRVEQGALTDAEFERAADNGLHIDAGGKVYRPLPTDHIDRRTVEGVGKKNVNAFQFDHPELQNYYKKAAESLLADADISTQFPMPRRTERTVNGKRTIQHAIDSVSLRSAMDMGLSRNQIMDAAQALIHDHGQENYAAAKRLEIVLDEMLTNGYTTVFGKSVEPNGAYVSAKSEIVGSAPAQHVSTIPDELDAVPRDTPGGTAAVNENGLNALSEREQINLSSGKKSKIISTFSDTVNFVRNALMDKQSVERAFLGKIPDPVAQKVLTETGVDITGFGVMMNGNDIRHIVKDHGDPLVESARGQITVMPEDIARIPEILSNPDTVSMSGELDGKGRKAIVFEKQIGNRFITVQGISDGKNVLQTDTLYIQKGRTRTTRDTMLSTKSAAPVINAQGVPPQSSSANSIPASGMEVNAETLSAEETALLLKIRNSYMPLGMQNQLIQANILVGKLPKGAEAELPGGAYVTAERGRYLDALARDTNEPPETRREPVSQSDLDELWKLWADQANPITNSETRKDEALAEAENMVTANSGAQKKTVRESAQGARSYFMRKMVDAGDSVSKVQKLTGDQYLYDYYNMARSSASAGINMLNGEQTDISGKRVGDSLNSIFDPIRKKGADYYNAFQMYLLHLHNIDRMSIVNGENTAKLEAEAALSEFDRENPDIATVTEARLQRKAEGTDQKAELARERLSLLRKVNQADRLGNKPVFGYEVTADDSRGVSQRLLREHPEFAEYQKKVRAYIQNLMHYRVDSGLMTKDDAEFLEKYYPNYVPTYRKTEAQERRTNQKSVKIGKTVGRAEGGNAALVPLHEAIGKQTMSVVREGGKNRFGQRLLDDWDNHPQQVKKYISDVQKYDAGFSADTFDSLDSDPALQKSNTFFVYQNGKMMELEVDPSLFDAVKALSPSSQETNELVRGIRAGNNLFKALVTGYNPMFTMRNTVRDLQTAGLYSRDLAAFAKNYPLALKEIAANGAYWKKYKALGGSFSSVFDYRTGTVKESNPVVQKTLGRVEALNMAMEQAPRLAEFMSIVKKGDGSMENLMDAMHAAADVTVNFGRSGTLGKVLNANFVPFLNPGIQGFSRMVRRVTETKGAKEWAKLAVRAAALGVAPALLNALLYRDDHDWDDLRDSDKDTNYLFKIGDGMWLKLPKGRELSVLGMTGQRIKDLVDGKDVDWRDFIATVGNQVAPANPLNQNILKAWFDADLTDSKSPGKTWYGGDIEGQRLRNYAPGQRYDSSTDIFSKWLGGKLNLSPKKINYLLDQYSGVVGDFVLPMLTPQAERNAFVKAFTVDSVSSNHISSQFYNQGDAITYAKNDGDTSMRVVSRFWNKQVTACGKIYAQIREIENSDSLTDAEKRERVREAKAVLNGIQKNAMATLETYQSAAGKHLKGSSDDAVDTAYREANRDCFGAEYALQVYNMDTYEKARLANQNGVSYDDFYRYYFDTRDFAPTDGKSAATQKMEYLESSSLKETTKAELYFADLASDSDLVKQAELEKSADISPVQYWNYKVATNGLSADTDANGKTISGSKKKKVLAAINGLDLTKAQKNALYDASGYARSTLDEAPWYYTLDMPRLGGGSGRSSGKPADTVPKPAPPPKLIGGTTLGQYGLDKYRLK